MNLIDLIVTVCAIASPTTCEEGSPPVRVERLAAAMRDGGATLHRPVDRRASEMERRAVALRVSTPKGQGRCARTSARGVTPSRIGSARSRPGF